MIKISDDEVASVARRCILWHKFFQFNSWNGTSFWEKVSVEKSTGKYAEPHVGKVDYFNDIIP